MPTHGGGQEFPVGQFRQFDVQHDLNRGFLLAGLKFQMFTIYIENNAGTIRHYFQFTDRQSGCIDRFHYLPYATGTFANTPTVSNVVGFGGTGMGILSGTPQYLIFDTIEPQHPEIHIGVPILRIHDGSNTIPRVGSWVKTDDINGVTKPRLSFFIHNDMTGAAIPAWTTFLASTRRIGISWIGFLK